MSGILGQGIRSQICETLADDEAGECNAVEKAILENGIGMFAICADSENAFTYWIAGLYKGGDVPGGLELYSFPASEWAVFTTKGPMPASLQTLNTASDTEYGSLAGVVPE